MAETLMPFPFLPGGAILAAAVLGGAFALFALLLRAIDRTATEIKGSFLPGVVSGLRGWSRPRDGRQVPERSPQR
jgi:hypothetical protein